MDGQAGFALLIAFMLAAFGYAVIKLTENDGKPPPHSPAEPSAEVAPAPADPNPGGAWSTVGWLLAIFSAVGVAVSLSIKTTVETYVPLEGSSEVANLDLMFQKSIALAGSLTGLGIGVFCIAVGAIIRAIASR